MKKILCFIAVTLMGVAAIFAQSPNYQGIIYVTPTGAGTHSGDSWTNATSSIADAQAIAQAHNAVVWVAAGVYYGDTSADTLGGNASSPSFGGSTSPAAFSMVEGVNVYGGFAGNEPAEYNLALRDFAHNETILDGQHARRVLYQPGYSSGFDSLTVWDGFTIRNGRISNYFANTVTHNHGAGASITKNGCLKNCVISHNQNAGKGSVHFGGYAGGGGVYMGGGSCLSNCLIVNNTAASGGGVFGRGNIYNSTIARNIADHGGAGICAYDFDGGYDSLLTLSNCIVWGNEGSANINISVTGKIFSVNSAVEGGCAGYNNVPLTDNGIFQPLFVNPSLTAGASDTTTNTDWHLQNGSVCINRGDNNSVFEITDMQGVPRILQDTVDMGCYETPYFSSTVPDVTYQGVVFVTPDGAGTQTGENWDNATSSIGFATAIARIHNASVWVAAGTYYGDTTSHSAFFAVEGVNVYGGFMGNEPINYNISLRNPDTNPTILDGQNIRRVLYGYYPKNSVWDGFIITHGRADDEVVSYSNKGYGGGVFFTKYGALHHCIIKHNFAQIGGGIFLDAKNHVDNCLVANNTSVMRGGGICLYNATDDTIVNSTITRNLSYGDGGGIYVCGGPVIITNCLIWGNEHTDDFYRNNVADNISECGNYITCSYSAIENGYEGVNNIPLMEGTLLQPLFVNPSVSAGVNDATDNVNWHLQEGSICINRGNNDAVTDSVDLSGEERNRRDTVDIGCFESDFYRSPVSYTEQTITSCDSCVWNGNIYETTGNYTYTTTDANGYVNVDVLHLQLNHSANTDVNIEWPNDYGYLWHGTTYTESGDYMWTGQTVHGCDSVVTLHLTITAGIDNYDFAAFMTVYPNPTNGIVNVECEMGNGKLDDVKIQLYDVYGKLVGIVETQNFASLQSDAHNTSAQTTQIDLSRYANGVYFIKAVADGNVIGVRKVVKQ